MENLDNDSDINQNIPIIFKFDKWPLDADDDEFLAGYPFTSDTETATNEQDICRDVSSLLSSDDDDDNNDCTCVNPQDACNGETEVSDQSKRSLVSKHDQLMDLNKKSFSICIDHENFNVDVIDKKNHHEHHLDGHNTDNINHSHHVDDKKTNNLCTRGKAIDHIAMAFVEAKVVHFE